MRLQGKILRVGLVLGAVCLVLEVTVREGWAYLGGVLVGISLLIEMAIDDTESAE